MKQKLTAAAICALALGFNALANVAYDKEYTNEWFKVSAASANLGDTERWTMPTNGTAEVAEVADSKIIKLDTDLDDPLTYKPTSQSEDVAIVTARFEATANTAEPELNVNATPQAALTVIVKGGETNWWGLAKGDAGNTWVKFTNVTPTVGEEYEIQIEFDLRSNKEKRIRYSVGGTVLVDEGSTDGWYGNPRTDAAAIQTVSFSGTGDIGNFGGDNVGEVTPVASVTGTSQTDGFDYTNGTLNVTLNSAAAGTATLKVIDFATGAVKAEYTQKGVASGESTISWQIADKIGSLIAGGIYSYEVTVTPESTDATHAAVTKAGTFVAANPTNDVNWFWADATGAKIPAISGGEWDTTAAPAPQPENNVYVIEDGAKFNVNEPSKGSNNLTRVDVNVTFESMVTSFDEVTGDALGGFVAASVNSENVWMAYTKTSGDSKGWVALDGAVKPEAGVPYVIRAEISFLTAKKQVRYLVKKAADDDFCVLTSGNSQWIDLANDSVSLSAVEMQGSGALAKLEANIADKALFEVDDVRYDNMEDALAAAGTNGTKKITLLTNATIEPDLTTGGKYDIEAGGHQYVSGGKVSSGDRTIVIPGGGEEPLVRPSEAVMKAVTAPGLTKPMNTDKLRAFLEKNGIPAYTDGDKGSDAITAALAETADNNLKYWQDYALGIDKNTPVAPVTTPAGDTNEENITLAIPTIDKNQYSGEYTIGYQVMKDNEPVKSQVDEDPRAILIPLNSDTVTGTYQIKAVFTPAQ